MDNLNCKFCKTTIINLQRAAQNNEQLFVNKKSDRIKGGNVFIGKW